MDDEIPAPPTPNGPSGDQSDGASTNSGPASSRSDRADTDRDGSDRTESERTDTDRAGGDRAEPDRLRDGVDPPEVAGGVRSERDRSEADEECNQKRDEERDPEPMEYRLERLRLWRTVVTLAVVVARLIRSL